MTVDVACRAYCFPCIAPKQDLETVVQGSSLNSPSFQQALHLALRTLIDDLGMTTFNVGITGMNAVSANLMADFSTEDSRETAALGCRVDGVVAR